MPDDRYTSYFRVYIFEAVQFLDMFLQVVYILVFFILSLSTPLHYILVVLSVSIFLRATFSFCSVCSWIISIDATYVLQVSLYIDMISSNFSSFTVLILALNRCLMLKSPRWNLKFFGSYRCFNVLIGVMMFSVPMAVLQIDSGDMQRDYSLEFGLIDFRNDPSGLHACAMKLFYLYPIFTIACYIIRYLHIKKTARSGFSNYNVKGEGNIAIKILIICALQIILYGLNDFSMALSATVRFQLSIDVFTSYAAYIPEMMLPLFLLSSKVELRERIHNFKMSRTNPFIVSNFY